MTAPPAPVAEPAHAQNSWFWPALFTGGFVLLVLALWRRIQARPTLQPQPAGMGSYSEAPRGFGAHYDPRGPAPGYGNPYPSAPTGGSGIASAVVGGLAGVAAGYALSKALEDHGRPVAHGDSTLPRANSPMDDVGLVRMDGDANALDGFDVGAGDGWDAPADDEDNW